MAGRYPGLDEIGTKANLHACMAQLAFWCCLVLHSLGAERMAGEICLPSATCKQAASCQPYPNLAWLCAGAVVPAGAGVQVPAHWER